MNLKKVLIVTYYWPPAGGPGVQRWLKFAKYLPEFGVEPIIYTPENPSYPVKDNSLLAEIPENITVIKKSITEPYKLAEMINPANKDYKAGQFEDPESQSLLSKLSVYVRGNFFIPDARVFWVKPSVKFLNTYLKENSIDTIITTGPPHSMHLIGKLLKQVNPELKWLADFRDPWTQISYHSKLKLGKAAEQKHLDLEKDVLQSADCVIATGYSDAENYRNSGAKRVEVITNGYEESDFTSKPEEFIPRFRMVYSGGLESARNPLGVWKALQQIIKVDSDFANNFQLVFYGNLSREVKESIEEHGLGEFLVRKGYVTHKESVEGIKRAEILLLTNFPEEQSKGIIPGKIFEYLATENPILAIGPEGGDVEKILEETQGGGYFIHKDTLGIKNFIKDTFDKWKWGDEQISTKNYSQFSRRNLTQRLAEILLEGKLN